MKRFGWTSVAAAALAGIVLLAPRGDADAPAPASAPEQSVPPVSFRRDVVPLFVTHCVFCHMKEGPHAGLILEPRFAYSMIVGVPSTETPLQRVQPGNPERSYLLLKMQNRHREVGGTGSKMPIVPGGMSAGVVTATPAQIELVRAWIQSGARDD